MQQVAVITGASSGIGRATAVTLARRGTQLVLAARGIQALRQVARECEAYGVQAIAVQTDVSKEADVARLAATAVDRFGSFSVWINNAGVTALGAADDIPAETFRRVIETNYLGCVYGSQAALKQFKIQSEGTLINIASLFGAVASPYESPYIASKFAVRGLNASIREELLLDGYPDIHACTILPAAIDTPIYRNAANYTGQKVTPIGPIYPVSVVTDAILCAINEPQPEIYAGSAGKSLAAARSLLPTGLFERLFGRYIRRQHFDDEPADPTDGNAYIASRITTIGGGWGTNAPQKTRLLALAAAGAFTGLAVIWWLRRRQRRSQA